MFLKPLHLSLETLLILTNIYDLNCQIQNLCSGTWEVSTAFLYNIIVLWYFTVGRLPKNLESGLHSIWEKYYEEAHAVVYVIDASCPSCFEDSKSALEKILRHEDLQGAPLLILANKQVK
ncbi:unnamed protein product, partial [Vitis vinifera]|uniref:ADP-ribosylation factor-related protein 1 n=1 Tax=Vitis vinifera TaxID=29760 RepID=D7SX15_VITVI